MGYSMKDFLTLRDEFFGLVRWVNLTVGLLNIYLFTLGGGYPLLGLGALNIGVWVFTRKSRWIIGTILNTLFALLIFGAYRYGEYITDECPQAGYVCPKYCDVDHICLPLPKCKERSIEMPKGKGTYGKQVGRPPKKIRKPAKKK